MQAWNLKSVLFLLATVVLGLVSFNLYVANSDLQDELAELQEEVVQLQASQETETAIYTKTEDFLESTFEGGAITFFTDRLKEEATESKAFVSQDGMRSETVDFEIFNISVRKQEEEFQVYAIYKVALTGLEGEWDQPHEQQLLYLSSDIRWVKEDGEWKVDRHDLQPLSAGAHIIEANTSSSS
ncbi:hypothetical protein [Planococcus lenghuensis]|uniref:Uncharacterized protein n=1 Tax=Planococcus lenghuensis TaxID=2213202 RepID=A0A1Q2L570_9BACL|nr:hypothetical protein [Planococcus lenghuensis]AQQ55590.1 hypothetical protein B0X71_20675 [Planococcus lenghuensis]